MTIWILSAHGGVKMTTVAGRQSVPLLAMPHGVSFYHCSAESMVSRPPMADFDRLLLGCKPGQSTEELMTQVHLQKQSGNIPNYTMTFTTDFGPDKLGLNSSGIFLAGDPFRRHPSAWTPPNHYEYTLDQFFKSGYLKSGDTIAWMCCRVWHSAARSAFMRHSGGSGAFTATAPE